MQCVVALSKGGGVASQAPTHRRLNPPGSADATVIPSGIGGFIACKALSRRNDAPTTASRPWDKNRDGFVMGEGAGASCMLRVCCSHCLRTTTR